MSGVEYKQEVDMGQFVQMLRQCADALERDEDMDLTLDGKTVSLHPHGRMKVSFEQGKDKSELEFEVKWREAA